MYQYFVEAASQEVSDFSMPLSRYAFDQEKETLVFYQFVDRRKHQHSVQRDNSFDRANISNVTPRARFPGVAGFQGLHASA
jgi:hypothetical protein